LLVHIFIEGYFILPNPSTPFYLLLFCAQTGVCAMKIRFDQLQC